MASKQNANQQLLNKEQFGVPLAYVPNYQGVSENRKFHDIFFGVFFLVFLAFCFGIGIWAFSERRHVDYDDDDIGKTIWDEQVKYLQKDVPIIIGLCVLALALALGWLMAIRKWPKFMIYMSIIVCAVLMITVGVLECYYGFHMGDGIFLGIWGIFMILIGALLLFVARRRGASIEFTAVVLTEAGHGLTQNSSLMFIVSPIASLVFMLFYFGAIAAIYFIFLVPGAELYPEANCPSLSGDSQICNDTTGCFWNGVQNSCEYQTKTSKSIYLIFVIIFGIYWAGNLKIMFTDCVTAGTIAKWYFTRGWASYSSNVVSGVKNAFWAFGSLSFGAMLIAIVQFIRMLLNSNNGSRGGIFGMVLYCCLRFLCCMLEAILRYISRYATIYIAMNGTNFWQSCKSVFNLFGRQSGWQAVMNDCLLGYINFTGGLICLGVPTLLAVLITGTHSGHWMTWLIVAVASCLIFVIIARCLRTAVDTIFVCFIEDMERNANGMTFLSTPDFMHSMCRHTKRPATAVKYVNWVPPQSSVNTTQPGVVVVTGMPVQSQQPQYAPQYQQFQQPPYQQQHQYV